MMSKICLEAEESVVYDELHDLTPIPLKASIAKIASAVDQSFSQNCVAIVCLTTIGKCVTSRM